MNGINKFQFVGMFPRTSKGQKPVDMFLANLKTVDMFLEAKVRTGRIVDMFLTAILRTGTKNDYLFRFLVPCRDRCQLGSGEIGQEVYEY